MDINVGDEFTMAFPFQIIENAIGNRYEPEIHESWFAGCKVSEEDDGSGYGVSRIFTANGEGNVIYKVLAVVEMPGKYIDRVVFLRSLVDPDGKKYGKAEVRTITKTLFIRDIGLTTPFKPEYEVE